MYRKAFAIMLSCFILILMASCAVSPMAESTPPARGETQTLPTEEPSAPATEPAVPEQIDTAAYSIFWEDDRCYMKFNNTEETNAPENAIISAHYPEFPSVRQMKQALLTGNLSPEEITELMRYASKDTNIVEICNIETFYDATFPIGCTIDYIQFSGRAYTFNFKHDDCYGFLVYYNTEDYDSKYKNLYEAKGMAKGIEVISNEASADGKKDILTYRYWDNTFKQIRYSIPTAYGQIDVLEQYTVSETLGNITESITMIDIFGNNNGALFYASVLGLEEPPAEEWLSAFGLREYVETEVS